MALSATMYVFEIQLSHVDRGVYEALSLRVAQHPSESDEYLITRLLAYCLEYTEGIAFSRGIAEPEEPTLAVRDMTGAIQAWIEIGGPDAPRLHKAGKAAPRVAVYSHRDATQVLRPLLGQKIFRGEALEIYLLDRALVTALVARLARRMTFDLSVSDGTLYVGLGGETLEGGVERVTLPAS